MWIADGIAVNLFAAEPMLRQPVSIEFDDRGRLWVIQYLQYPNPEGLKRVAVDRYSRTAYDRIPEPPPRGPKGSDRITILEDADGDGRAERSHDFVTGLNLASGLAFGYGGVFVLQAPYLLFYSDRDGDDRPDGDPEVLLTGFGMEDAHSVANSLTWGPDGWLYGLQGSTVTAKVREIEFQQGVWRYHPRIKRFELFCEGGGNMWGLDFDRHGQLFASTNVGGFVMLHGVQGGYYWKSFGKHGPLRNPYTFGYFDHVRHKGIQGGHVAVGGLFYEAAAFPPAWRGRYIAGDLLDHSVHGHEVSRRGSTFEGASGRRRPAGQRHLVRPDRHDARSRRRRLYHRLARPAHRASRPRRRMGPVQRADLLHHRARRSYRQEPRSDNPQGRRGRQLAQSRQRLVSTQGASSAVRASRRQRRSRSAHSAPCRARDSTALEALWALYGCVGLDEMTSLRLLEHRDADVRAWCIRLLGDESPVSSTVAERLAGLAVSEPDAIVRAQLASTARRLSPGLGLEIAYRILARDLDGDDPHLPLLLWWAVERGAETCKEQALTLFASPAAWRSRMIRAAILGRLMRRYALTEDARGDDACARLLASAPTDDARRPLLVALDEAMRGRKPETVADALSQALYALADREPGDMTLTRLGARLGEPTRHAIGSRAVAGDRRRAPRARPTRDARTSGRAP